MAGKRVLILEDNATISRILTVWLVKFGMKVTSVDTSEAALDLLRKENEFDAAIFDYQLPGTDVLDLVDASRKLPGGKSLHLLLLTSIHLRAGNPRAAAATITASVYKPIRPKQLLDALCQVFDHRLNSARKPPAVLAFDSTFATRLPLRILLADDNRVNQKVGSCFLEKLGYRVTVVANGLEVIQALERQPSTSSFWMCKCR